MKFQNYECNEKLQSTYSREFGKSAIIDSFLDTFVTVRRSDGSLVTSGISPYPALLHSYVAHRKWDDAVKLARFVKVPHHINEMFS